ncbi:hypothetical protein BCR33DRAFT_845342 [Rhizoclosmatium globosum]|uniref:Uncharacterized protein n=1 Tax=Rhizoclosmatium globosum TaxID=329046 RepID=A0A1Y2D1F4_9FUNG|nr:hypothetical protein BCR33DRAFT_845342 [Rhizoclosmatium globosum]|eukprot:ORY53112.1 hypothetical protein BCR33DRAFT_845342 [Rhizoclosmatium globosum]
MATTLTLQPLPEADEDTQEGNSPFVYGYCGLEGTLVRGLVAIDHRGRAPLSIAALRIEFKGVQTLSFARENGDVEKLSKILVLLSETILTNETIPPGAPLSIPFSLALPEPSDRHAPLMKASIRLANLLQPSTSFKGLSSYHSTYEGATTYTLTATLQELPQPSLPPLCISTHKDNYNTNPSIPCDSPLEYEIELCATTIGPQDDLTFRYRLAVARDAAARGVRVKKVSLVLREHKTMGSTISTLIPSTYKCIKSSSEVTRWEFEEADFRKTLLRDREVFGNADDRIQDFEGVEIEGDGELSNDEGDEDNLDDGRGRRISNQPKGRTIKVNPRLTSKPVTPANRNQKQKGFNAGFVEMSELRPRRKMVDGLSSYTPSHTLSTNASTYDHTFRPQTFSDGWSGGLVVMAYTQLVYPNPHQHMYQTVPYLEVKHTLQVRVEMYGVEKPIVHECWAVVASIGKRGVFGVLDNRVELMPTMDYDKVVGNDVWVPRYEREDPFLGDLVPAVEYSEEHEDDLDAFFGELKHLIRNHPPPPPATLPEGHPLLRKEKEEGSGLLSVQNSAAGRSRSVTPNPLGTPSTTFHIINSLLYGYETRLRDHEDDSENDLDYYKAPSYYKSPIPSPKKLPTLPSTSPDSSGPSKHRKMSINTLMGGSVPPPLPSAHTILAHDAAAVSINSPTHARVLLDIKNLGIQRQLHYPQTCLDVSPSSSGGSNGDDEDVLDSGEDDEDDESEEVMVIKHPLLADEEVEARRRKAIARKIVRGSRSGGSGSTGMVDVDNL